MTTESAPANQPAIVDMLQDWQDAGAHWQVVARSNTTVTIALLRCDGGEEVDRVTSTDPTVIAYLDAHDSSQS